MEKQDEELISEYWQGSQEAFEMLFQRYKKPIFNFAFRILGNRADAEDITGDVFLKIMAQKNVYQPREKFSPWLFTVARNACISKIRKRKNMISLWFAKNESGEYEQWDIPDSGALPREELAKREKTMAVKKAVYHLPAEQKEALILREYHQLSYEQIAHILDCSLGNVKILIFRARERLRDHLPSFITEDYHD